MCQKENTNKKRQFTWFTPEPCRTKQWKQSLNSRTKICPLHQLGTQFSMKWTMSSVDIYFTFYRNIKFYSKSLKHTSFSTWFDSLFMIDQDLLNQTIHDSTVVIWSPGTNLNIVNGRFHDKRARIFQSISHDPMQPLLCCPVIY